MIIPGIVSVTFREQTADWILERCRMAGLKAVEWSENAHVFPDDPEGAADLYQRTAAAGLAIAAYGSYYRLGQQGIPSGQQATLERESLGQPVSPEQVFMKSLRSAVALKAPVIRIWAGVKPSRDVDGEEFELLAREAAVVAELAQAYGIKVALEWHRNTLTDTNESGLRFIQMAAHPNLYCLWQPTVELSMKERIEGIEMLGARMLNLHIYYWRDGVKRPLAEGTAEWEQYLGHVDKTVSRYGLMEFVMDEAEEQFLEDAAVLHELLKGR